MRGLHWSEFIPFLQRNRTSTPRLRFYGPTKDQPDKMTICDFDLPRRKGKEVAFAWEEKDWFLNSQVVVGGWDEGYIPFRGWAEPRPIRGAIAVAKIMLEEGSLRRSDEVQEWLRKYDHP